VTWRECLDARGELDVTAVAGTLRRARRAGSVFGALLRLGRRVCTPYTVQSVLEACDAALACLEVVDSVWSDLASLPVTLSVDGEVGEHGQAGTAADRLRHHQPAFHLRSGPGSRPRRRTSAPPRR